MRLRLASCCCTRYEAAELEHNLMCTYLYAAFSLRDGESESLSAEEAAAVARWRREIIGVAVREMGHLTAVCNITSALGGSPRFGRGNFPLDPGGLPANVVVKRAPFSDAVLAHVRRAPFAIGARMAAPPPVNLVAVREGGPYAVRGDSRLDGEPAGYRLTLCRCGASKNKPFCDGSHARVGFRST